MILSWRNAANWTMTVKVTDDDVTRFFCFLFYMYVYRKIELISVFSSRACGFDTSRFSHLSNIESVL